MAASGSSAGSRFSFAPISASPHYIVFEKFIEKAVKGQYSGYSPKVENGKTCVRIPEVFVGKEFDKEGLSYYMHDVTPYINQFNSNRYDVVISRYVIEDSEGTESWIKIEQR